MRNGSGRRVELGMTLVEIMCVIGIILCLSALTFPTIAEARRGAKVATCLSNLGSVQRALRLYSIDYDDQVPRGKDCVDQEHVDVHPVHLWPAIKAMPLLPELSLPYAKSRDLWRCPLDSGVSAIDTLPSISLNGKPTLFGACGMSYRYVTSLGMGASWTSLERVTEQMVLSDQAGHWHVGAQGLESGMVYGDWEKLWTKYRYNVAYFDGHVSKNRTYIQVRDASGVAR